MHSALYTSKCRQNLRVHFRRFLKFTVSLIKLLTLVFQSKTQNEAAKQNKYGTYLYPFQLEVNDIEVHKCLSAEIPIHKGFIRFKGILHTKAYG